MRTLIGAAVVLFALAGQSPAYAQDAPAPPPGAETAAPRIVPAGTLLDLELVTPASSKDSKVGDRLVLRLTAPLVINGVEVLPAGVTGVGEVTTATPAGFMAKGGELMVLARYLDYGGQRIPLRGMQLGLRGDNNLFVSFVAAQAVGPLALFVKGGNIVFPAGTAAQAKVAAATPVEPVPTFVPAPPAAPAAEQPPAQASPAA